MNRKESKILLVLFFLANLAFLFVFADRNGYEGDDLNSILPMLHLGEAKRGELLIYRYYWQPLSYEMGSAVFELTKDPSSIFLLSPIAGATSLLLLLQIVWKDRRSISEFTKSLIALLAVPELWFSGLYYNSTVIGLPFALGARMLVRPGGRAVDFLFAGLLLSISALMRLDFILISPILALFAWQSNRSLLDVASLALGVIFPLCLAMLFAILDPAKIVEIYLNSAREIADKAQVPGWDLRMKAGVVSVLVSPLGWAIMLLGGPIVALQLYHRNKLSLTCLIASVLPLCLPLPNLLSVKYAIPLLMFVPSFLVLCVSSIEGRIPTRYTQWLLISLLGCSTVLVVFSASFFGHLPFVGVGTVASRPIATHDGLRSYGGYLWQMCNVDRDTTQTDHQVLATRIKAEFLQPGGPDILIAGDENFFNPGGAAWRDLQLQLEGAKIRGAVVSPHQIEFSLNGRRLTLMRDLPSDPDSSFDRGRGLKLYDLR